LDETWRLIHLVAAAFWLGGMIVLAVVAVIAARSADLELSQDYGRFERLAPALVTPPACQ
jgi:putative copper export protein